MEKNDLDEEVLIGLSYIPLIIIAVGVVFNISAFLVFICKQKMRKMSSMIFLSFIAIIDTCALFTWNLNHYLQPNGLPSVESLSLASCRFFNFLQYFSLQCSGVLYSMVSVDRYFTIICMPGSFVSKLPFGTTRAALGWCTCTILVIAIVNCHMLFMQGFIASKFVNVTEARLEPVYNHTANLTHLLPTVEVIRRDKISQLVCFVSEDGKYLLNPMWDYVNLAIYNFLPFIVMAVFNTLLILKTFIKNAATASTTSQEKASNNRKRRLTVSLFIITVSFLIMTLPGSLAYGFFYDILRPTYIGHAILIACDCFLFTQHAIIFFMCFATNIIFRNAVIEAISRCCRFNITLRNDTTTFMGTRTIRANNRTGNENGGGGGGVTAAASANADLKL